MIEELASVVKRRLKQGATVEQVLEELRRGGSLTDKSARNHIIIVEFFRLMGEGGRTAHDIEQELSARYDISVSYVRKIRLEYTRYKP